MQLDRFQPGRPFHRRGHARAAAAPPDPVDDVLTGMVLPYGGATVPEGYLDCDGSAVSRLEYAALFAVMGTAYGIGDGTTTFNVPDFRSRSLLGAGAAPGRTPRNRGDTGGAERVTLATAELPSHSHDYEQPLGLNLSTGEVQSGSFGSCLVNAELQTNPTSTGMTGAGSSHENVPPFGVVRWIVKA